MKISDMRKALDIFAKYTLMGEQSSWCAGADHDIIWSNVGEADISEDSEDGEILQNLGWHLSYEFDCWSKFV